MTQREGLRPRAFGGAPSLDIRARMRIVDHVIGGRAMLRSAPCAQHRLDRGASWFGSILRR